MTRTNTKNPQQDPTQGIAEAINTPTGEYLSEVAERLGITDTDLKERLAAKLDNDDPLDWDVILPEYQSLIDAIANDLDAERSTRKLEPEEIPLQLPDACEPTILEEPEPKPKSRKKQSTALTKKKAESLKKSDQNSQQLAATDVQIKQALHVKKGQKSGAQLATLELVAEDSTYRKIKGEALVRKVAQLSAELAAEEQFDAIQVLEEMGVDPNSEIYEQLREQLESPLGKLESATAEIVENAWLNGIDLESEIGNLQRLLNSSES